MISTLLFEEWASSLEVAAFDLPCLLVILILFVKAPAAPILETLGPQVKPTLAVTSFIGVQEGKGGVKAILTMSKKKQIFSWDSFP